MTKTQETDYAAEATAVLQLVIAARNGDSKVNSLELLQVGPGEKPHREHLAKWFGKASHTMVDIRTMSLGRPGLLEWDPLHYDVVLCFSWAIGDTWTVDDLRQATQKMTEHLRTGGILIIEPNLDRFTQEQYGGVLLDAGLEVHFNNTNLSRHGHGVYYGIKST